MNYKIAKQLKDAGFPQVSHYTDEFDFIEDGSETKSILGQEDFVSDPTLDELIQECGIEFSKLINESIFTDVEVIEKWCAESFSGRSAAGDTPKEAVAKLWLATHGGNNTTGD